MIIKEARGSSPIKSGDIMGGGVSLESDKFGCLYSNVWDIEEDLGDSTEVHFFKLGVSYASEEGCWIGWIFFIFRERPRVTFVVLREES